MHIHYFRPVFLKDLLVCEIITLCYFVVFLLIYSTIVYRRINAVVYIWYTSFNWMTNQDNTSIQKSWSLDSPKRLEHNFIVPKIISELVVFFVIRQRNNFLFSDRNNLYTMFKKCDLCILFWFHCSLFLRKANKVMRTYKFIVKYFVICTTNIMS